MILINLIETDELIASNYLLNLSVHTYYSNLNKNLKIIYIENQNQNQNQNLNQNLNQNQNQNHDFDLILNQNEINDFLSGCIEDKSYNYNFHSNNMEINYFDNFFGHSIDFFLPREEEKLYPYNKRFCNLYKKNKYKYKKKEIKNNPKYKKNYR